MASTLSPYCWCHWAYCCCHCSHCCHCCCCVCCGCVACGCPYTAALNGLTTADVTGVVFNVVVAAGTWKGLDTGNVAYVLTADGTAVGNVDGKLPTVEPTVPLHWFHDACIITDIGRSTASLFWKNKLEISDKIYGYYGLYDGRRRK